MSLKKTPTSREKALFCAQVAQENKAEVVGILDFTHSSHFTDYFVICQAASPRQVKGIADCIKQALRSDNPDLLKHLTLEGYSEGRWVLMDFQEFIVHILLDVLQDYYRLDQMWETAPRLPLPAAPFERKTQLPSSALCQTSRPYSSF